MSAQIGDEGPSVGSIPAMAAHTDDLLASLPGPLRAGAAIAHVASGCDAVTAVLIALAAQGIAAGPAHRMASPRGFSVLFPAPDLLLVDGPDGQLGSALAATLSPISGRSASILRKHMGFSREQIRAQWAIAHERRQRLESELESVDAQLKAVKEHHAAGKMPPGGGPCGMLDLDLGERRKRLVAQAVPAAIEEAETTFALRSGIFSGGITRRMVDSWPAWSFDGRVADRLSSGDAVVAFLNTPPKDLSYLLTFIEAAGHGEDIFTLADRQFVDASIQMLWLCDQPDAGAILGHPAIADGPLSGRHLVLMGPAKNPVDQSPDFLAALYGPWSRHLSDLLFTIRLCGGRFSHALGKGALMAHGEFREACAAAVSEAASPGGRAHLRSLPSLTLRLALSIHIAGKNRDNAEVSADDYAVAARIASAASRIHLSCLDRFRPTQLEQGDSLDLEIQAMVVKLRLRGSCTRRELFRGYHKQHYPELERVLIAAIDDGRIVMRGDLLLPAPADCRQRVSPPAEVGK